ncbi:single-stranded DNA-binding protein [Paenalcaligenes hominis]|uniref:Single-stranded DNA-binding protein n=1 Tax=Paenalcaligenes hominis TaxID=643674 RepID=A0A1U9JXQ0_9BURK|nr:single-stranded DNA-binding protein [Paenalcaligenes hominis]AQS50521.1 single-stranded DNA-binding protein [Paenalcaligenes hominis]
MAQLIGVARLGRDAVLRYTHDGTPVADLSLAFIYGRKDPNTGKRPTQWVKGSLWGQRAESLTSYLIKGSRLNVTLDDVHIQTFSKQDGTQGVALEGRVLTIEFVDSPNQQQQPQQQSAPPPQQPQRNYQAPSMSGMSDMDDDIPFNAYFARNAYCI